MLGVPVRGGTSTTWTLLPGARVLMAFDGGDPSLPSIVAMDGVQSGDLLTSVSFGTAAAAQFVALSSAVDANFANVKAAAQAGLTAAVPNDGGKATHSWLSSQLSLPRPTACKRLKSD